ncbi:helix-turn-helix domain-containing protein [Streptomyces qinglanensis]|uniref:helix-turn-helix domain-containing protein n=1 Tax=Streptomyces qinglanensis TaxID=943816 RepID=UPI003D71771A
MSTRSHANAPTARTTPSLDRSRAARCTQGLRDITGDLHGLAESLLRATHNNVSPTEIAQLIAGMNGLLEQATGALVVRQRSQGKPLTGIATALDRSEDRLRKKYPPQDIDHQLATRRRPGHGTKPGKKCSAPSSPLEYRNPHQRVAAALTLMVNESSLTQRDLAAILQVDPSYISRMLSGEREASWPHVKAICDACRGNHRLLKPLWEVAAGVPPNTNDPIQYLRTYLCALHYAAGSPGEARILASVSPLAPHDLQHALDGPGVPNWEVITHVVAALQGIPETARPMWTQARRTVDETSPAPAEAFG